MLINDEGTDFGIEGVGVAEKQAPESPEVPTDYKSGATKLERDAFDTLERLISGIDFLPEYAKKGQELLAKAREDIKKETAEFMRQPRVEEVVKPRAGDNIRFSLDHDLIGQNYVDAYNGYMFDAVKEKYIKAQDAYMNGDKAKGDMLMKNTEGMAWVIIRALESGTNESIGLEWGKKRPEDIFEIVKIEMQQDSQKNPSERFSKN